MTSYPEQPFHQFTFKIPGSDTGPVIQENSKKGKPVKRKNTDRSTN
ncbi:hypothetical protein MmTuc01_2003 [Methanosarcina mazei Tuc01]|uniref:Uncharacterized protein n=1 Tax=Methanosarcina mazei Tuc01 TaxID=1236903 RepID=M1PYD1_METMZ|nr:hypothetical protein MmTuc01_2003 [Methanosarcina mazei Tuc01]